MSSPVKINKGASQEDIKFVRWWAFVDFAAQVKVEELSPIQRTAYIAYWYNNELQNGGHLQYIYNMEFIVYEEVLNSLNVIGAKCQSYVLLEVMNLNNSAKLEIPTDYDKYISWNKKCGYEDKIFEFDRKFYECRPEIETELLDEYLKQNECEFIKWE